MQNQEDQLSQMFASCLLVFANLHILISITILKTKTCFWRFAEQRPQSFLFESNERACEFK